MLAFLIIIAVILVATIITFTWFAETFHSKITKLQSQNKNLRKVLTESELISYSNFFGYDANVNVRTEASRLNKLLDYLGLVADFSIPDVPVIKKKSKKAKV